MHRTGIAQCRRLKRFGREVHGHAPRGLNKLAIKFFQRPHPMSTDDRQKIQGRNRPAVDEIDRVFNTTKFHEDLSVEKVMRILKHFEVNYCIRAGVPKFGAETVASAAIVQAVARLFDSHDDISRYI